MSFVRRHLFGLGIACVFVSVGKFGGRERGEDKLWTEEVDEAPHQEGFCAFSVWDALSVSFELVSPDFRVRPLRSSEFNVDFFALAVALYVRQSLVNYCAMVFIGEIRLKSPEFVFRGHSVAQELFDCF